MINWAQVAELRREVGAEDFEEVLGLFFEEVEEVTLRLSKTVLLTQLGEDLHFLKGSALNLGFEVFSEACNEGETLCAAGSSNTVNVTEILDIYRTSKVSFLADLPYSFASDSGFTGT